MRSIVLTFIDLGIAIAVTALLNLALGQPVQTSKLDVTFYLVLIVLVRYHDKRRPDA